MTKAIEDTQSNIEEPKKQTLEEFCIRNTPHGDLDILTFSEFVCLYDAWRES